MSQDRSHADRLSRFVLIGALLSALAVPAVATAAGIGAEIRRLDGRLDALARAAGFDPVAEQAFVTALTDLVARFRSAGGPAGDAPALRRLVERAHARYGEWLERRQREVMAADGDLEALQESAKWRGRESLAFETLYSLNWIHLEAATRYEPRHPERRAWLEQASDGFGQFAAAGDDRALAAESLFGRGLCRRELGQSDAAIADFRRAEDVPAPAELVLPIGRALVEALVDADRIGDALEASGELLRQRRSAEAEFLRAKVLLLALADRARGGSAAMRREAGDLIQRLDRRGAEWARLGRQLAAAGISRPDEWLGESGNATIQWVVAEALRGQGRCADAVPVYLALVASEDPPDVEALLALGTCQLEVGELSGAFDTLGRVPLGHESRDVAAEATYLRFKAAEAMHESDAADENARRLADAGREYVTAFPAHARAFEARFRLGELARAEGRWPEAAAWFDAVEAGTPLRLQALFEAGQCYAAAAERGYERTAETEERKRELARTAVVGFETFFAEAEALRQSPDARPADVAMLAPMEARARVVGALLLTGTGEPADLEKTLAWLDAYDETGAGDPALASETRLIRGVALLRLGRFEAADAAIAAFLAGARPERGVNDILRRLGVETFELAAREREAGHAERARQLERTSLAVYEALLAAVEEAGEKPAEVAGLKKLIASLKAAERSGNATASSTSN